MPAMTRSPLALARQALACAEEALPPYSSKFSRKDFTLHQCFAILVLKHFFQTDYRSIEQYLKDMSDLRDALGLDRVPDHSTLCRAHGWMLKKGLSTP